MGHQVYFNIGVLVITFLVLTQAACSDKIEGRLQGCVRINHDGENIFAFLGIPYAKPPVGPLRFKAPEPSEPWVGTRDATKEADACYSRNFFTGEYQGSEDCLYLNVFTKVLPHKTKHLKPVMVWIHGGGYIAESSSTDTNGPDFLITEDIVFVSLNYRLGLLGFLSLEDTDLKVPGNAGLKDQTLALRWVKRNIENFGGDPDNVTIFGNSAGSSSVHFHVLSEKSAGLFHKAILQSGSVFNPWNWGKKGVKEIMDKFGMTTTSEKEALDILSRASYEELYQVQEKLYDLICSSVHRPVGPVIEKPNKTAFITKDPMEIFRSGNYNKVPMIFGCNKTEGMFMEYNEMIFPHFDPPPFDMDSAIPWNLHLEKGSPEYLLVKKKMEEFYKAPERKNDKYLPFSTTLYFLGIVAAIENHVKTSKCPIYFYRMIVEGELNGLKVAKGLTHLPGTCHADEVGYILKNTLLPNFERGTLEDTTIRRFVKLWTNFAKCGNPTPDEKEFQIIWKNVNKDNLYFLDIGEELEVNNGLDYVKFWKDIYQMKPEISIFL